MRKSLSQLSNTLNPPIERSHVYVPSLRRERGAPHQQSADSSILCHFATIDPRVACGHKERGRNDDEKDFLNVPLLRVQIQLSSPIGLECISLLFNGFGDRPLPLQSPFLDWSQNTAAIRGLLPTESKTFLKNCPELESNAEP